MNQKYKIGVLVRWHNNELSEDLPDDSYLGLVVDTENSLGNPDIKVLWNDGLSSWCYADGDFEILS